jgi:hypothetical protein
VWLLKFVVGVFLVAGLALLVGGGVRLVQEQTDTRTLATVTSCSSIGAGSKDGASTECLATWTARGRQVNGIITGVSKHDVGKKIKVTTSGRSAFTISLVLPLVLIAVGLASLIGAWPFVRMLRTSGSKTRLAPA